MIEIPMLPTENYFTVNFNVEEFLKTVTIKTKYIIDDKKSRHIAFEHGIYCMIYKISHGKSFKHIENKISENFSLYNMAARHFMMCIKNLPDHVDGISKITYKVEEI